MEKYQSPSVNVKAFVVKDVITASAFDNVGGAKPSWDGWSEGTGGEQQ